MIRFNVPPFTGKEMDYIKKAVENQKICGDGDFTKKCNSWIEDRTGTAKALLVTSGSTALDMAAVLSEVGPGDEVILPSYTFVSTANAFVLRGATLVFVDIRPDTQNIDEKLIEDAITDKTKVIAPVHYAGVGCEMDTIMDIAKRHNLIVVEDAAQGVISTYKGRGLGSIGDYGCYSFHETKNYSMGEGGALLIRDEDKTDRAEIIREKILRLCDKEIPHGTAVLIEKMKTRDNGILDIDATIFCERETHKRIIIGKNGSMLKKISTYARQDIERFFDCMVFLQTWIKVKEDWRNRAQLVQNFGYDERNFD